MNIPIELIIFVAVLAIVILVLSLHWRLDHRIDALDSKYWDNLYECRSVEIANERLIHRLTDEISEQRKKIYALEQNCAHLVRVQWEADRAPKAQSPEPRACPLPEAQP